MCLTGHAAGVRTNQEWEFKMYIGTRAAETPDKPAVILARTGESVSYRELDNASMQVAQMLHARGLRRGDTIAIYMENHLRYMEVVWAAYRSGLLIATVNRYLKAPEVAYIVKDSGARFVFTSIARAEEAAMLPSLVPEGTQLLMVGGVLPGWSSYETALAPFPAERLAEEWMGAVLNYTSGTTGKPRGVLRALPELHASDMWPTWEETGKIYGFHRDMVTLCPAPLYHGAPMRSVRPAHMAGGTVVLMEKFDASEALRLIEKYRVTHTQWVPTMFVRMLRLSEEERRRYDLSSQQCAVHAAAPCSISVKRQMIAWWGPILHEYYGATDSAGGTFISCEEWLAHPGSVGKAPSTLHVCDEAGVELPQGETGLLYFAGRQPLPEYLNDPVKTRESRHPAREDWVCVGDVGYVDAAGYLFLTDRKSFTIISGGVNIYPKAIEEVLESHPAVADVAVFGVPNDEMGEEVKAVVELLPNMEPSDDLARTLIAFAASRLAPYMVPRSLEFSPELPRSPTGKLMKKPLRDAYWQGRTLVS